MNSRPLRKSRSRVVDERVVALLGSIGIRTSPAQFWFQRQIGVSSAQSSPELVRARYATEGGAGGKGGGPTAVRGNFLGPSGRPRR